MPIPRGRNLDKIDMMTVGGPTTGFRIIHLVTAAIVNTLGLDVVGSYSHSTADPDTGDSNLVVKLAWSQGPTEAEVRAVAKQAMVDARRPNGCLFTLVRYPSREQFAAAIVLLWRRGLLSEVDGRILTPYDQPPPDLDLETVPVADRELAEHALGLIGLSDRGYEHTWKGRRTWSLEQRLARLLLECGHEIEAAANT